MSQKQFEQLSELVVAEKLDEAADLFHQIVVEKSRDIYASILGEEEVTDADAEAEADDSDRVDESDEEGIDDTTDFTAEIEADSDEIDTDEVNGGEAEGDEDDDSEFGDDGAEDTIDDRVEDLEAQLDALRAEFQQLVGGEAEGDFGPDVGDEVIDDPTGDLDGVDDAESFDFGEPAAKPVYEKKASKKLDVAPQAKKANKDKKVDEATKFLDDVADPGMTTGSPKFAGTGAHSKMGADTTQSMFTKAPAKKDYGGGPIKMSAGADRAPGKYDGEKPSKVTKNTEQNPALKDKTVASPDKAKYVGGAAATGGDENSLLTHAPKQ